MNNIIIRWYNKNRKTIGIFLLMIIGVIGIIQTINSYYKNNPKDENSGTVSTTYNKNNYSVISKQKINEDESQELIYLIKNFFKYCNNNQIEYAYELLSKDCKEELYPTINDFKTEYYNKIFTEDRTFDSVLWITTPTRYTYKIQIMADILATGEKDSMPIEEYYTIVYENGEYKLNISSYIGKQDINISKMQDNINIDILCKKVYIDYEIYEIKIDNNTANKITFNTKDNVSSIYIQDENELKYVAFLNEIPDSEFEILEGTTKTLNIKFNRGYKSTINIERIIFEDIYNNDKKTIIQIEI